MQENLRVFFNILWLAATGCVFATGIMVIVTLGDNFEHFVVSCIVCGIATAGSIITSL